MSSTVGDGILEIRHVREQMAAMWKQLQEVIDLRERNLAHELVIEQLRKVELQLIERRLRNGKLHTAPSAKAACP
jgi:predicted HTH transcriptional regulator